MKLSKKDIVDPREAPEQVAVAELDLGAVKKRTITGVVSLILRNNLQTIISVVGLSLVGAVLGPTEFGTFIIVTAAVDVFNYFSDIGLAAALVQKHDKPSIDEFRSTFTLQQLLVTASVIVALAISPFIRQWNHLQPQGVLLLYAAIVSFWLVSLKSIPSVMLERKLEFQKIVFVSLVETLIFYVAVILLAYRGFGVTSYTIAILSRSLIGVGLLYFISPWPIGLSFNFRGLSQLFRYGIPYQINTFIALVKDRLTIIFLGGILGPAGIGIAGWAERYANIVLRQFMDPINTVTFPAYSRLQGDRAELGRMVSKSLFILGALVFPTIVGLSILAPWVLTLIPVYRKWLPATTALVFYGINAMWAAPSTHLTNLLNSIGRVRWNTYLMIFWTVLTWAFLPVLALHFGYNGMAFGTALIGCTSFIPMILARREVPYSLSPLLKTVSAALFMGVFLVIGRLLFHPTWLNLIALTIGGGTVYVATIYLLTAGTILTDAQALLRSTRRT
jgi:O-antigen/teichoic acid export membrane protein